jgi:N-acetylglucosamine transport system permease protein
MSHTHAPTRTVHEPVDVAGEPRRAGGRRGGGGDALIGGFSHGVLIIWSAVVIVPLLWVIMSSFKTSSEIFASPFALPASWNFDNYVNAWTTAGIGTFFLNSVIVVFCSLALTMLFGAMSAYVLARFSFPGNRLIYYLMLAGLTFPVFLAIVPLFFVLRGIGLLNTLPGLIVTYAASLHGVLPVRVLPVAVEVDRRSRRHGRGR